MAKRIIINYNGNEYTLEFNRKTVKRMEEAGFVIDTNKPMTMITDLFRGAFQMHHRRIDNALVEEIWAAQKKKDDLLGVLVEMYAEPLTTMLDEQETDDDTPTWTVQ